MARAGRRRKSRKRHPSGQLVKDKHPDDRKRVSRQPHRRALPTEDRTNERAESALGRLNLKHHISNNQFDAGEKFAAIVGAYRAVIEAPPGTSGSGRGFDCCGGEFTPGDQGCECARRKARYDAAYEAVLGAHADLAEDPADRLAIAMARAQAVKGYDALPKQNQRAAKAVARVAVHGEDLASQDLIYLDLGLSALARHFGLTGRRSREHS